MSDPFPDLFPGLALLLEDLSLRAQCFQSLGLLVRNFVHEVEQHLERLLDAPEQTGVKLGLVGYVAITRVDSTVAEGLENFEEVSVQFQGPLGSGAFTNILKKSSYLCSASTGLIPLLEQKVLKSTAKHCNGGTVGADQLCLVSLVKIEGYAW